MTIDGKKDVCSDCEHICRGCWQKDYSQMNTVGMDVRAYLSDGPKDIPDVHWISVDTDNGTDCRGYDHITGEYLQFPKLYINQHYGSEFTLEESEAERKKWLKEAKHTHEKNTGNKKDVPSLS